MKKKTTNYINTFIEVAEDCPTQVAIIPPIRNNKKSIANLQFEIIYNNPYKFTSDEVLFSIHSLRKNIVKEKLEEEKQIYFSKGQPCFRSSPLSKKYGWGIHSDENCKIALFGVETKDYSRFLGDNKIYKKRALRSKRE